MLLAASMASVAFAAWTTNGFGTFNASATTAKNVTFVSTVGISGLAPGVTKPVTLKALNPNPYPVAFPNPIKIGTPGITVDANHSDCNVDALSYTPPASLPTVGPGTSGAFSGGSVTLDNNANNSCQGATFTVSFFATGESAATPSGTAATNIDVTAGTGNVQWTFICYSDTTARMRIINNANGYIPAGALSYTVTPSTTPVIIESVIPQNANIIVDVANGAGQTMTLKYGTTTNTKAAGTNVNQAC